MKLYMARDKDSYDWEGYVQKGKICLFYDTPILKGDGTWGAQGKLEKFPLICTPN